MQTENRLAGRIDADLHLLDRQIVDSEGAFVGKVDDLELTPVDGRLLVTGLLLGAAAWVPRLSRRHSHRLLHGWHLLAPQRAERDVPGWISLDDVDHLDSDVNLSRTREGLVVPQPQPDDRHRVGMLLHGPVVAPDGRPMKERVRDLRLQPGGRYPEVRAVVVSRGRRGTMLGYDRKDVRGPVVVAQAIKALNRHTGELGYDDVEIDWDDLVVHAKAEPGPLTPLD